MDNKINPRITPIASGTVLDHLPVGSAIKILELLDNSDATISVAINVGSTKYGKKDLVYIDGKKLENEEKDKIGLIAPGSTLNTIRDHKIESKEMIHTPVSVEGILTCLNERCITNHEEIKTKFVIRKEPMRAKCFYCEKEYQESGIKKMLS